jgi:hypothetical protein
VIAHGGWQRVRSRGRADKLRPAAAAVSIRLVTVTPVGVQPEPTSAWDENAGRSTVGLRTILAAGLREGLIIPQGRTFTLRGLTPGKGPYAWFSRYPQVQRANPNWEYYVQVAEYVRLSRFAATTGLTVTFEDGLMDLALYRNGELQVCVEVKERRSQLQRLFQRLRTHEATVDLDVPDRGNNPLRKAKYLVKRRPRYLCGLALGARLEYRVDYPEGLAFRLEEDVVPWV